MSLFDVIEPKPKKDIFSVPPDMTGWSDQSIVKYQLLRDQNSLETAEDYMVEFYKERIESYQKWLEEIDRGSQTPTQGDPHQDGDLPV
jgi:hypothetical protein